MVWLCQQYVWTDVADVSQAPYGSYKTWKVLEFYFDIFQDWQVLEKTINSS